MLADKKIVFSGVQPSGNLTIGNYLGAIKNFSRFSEDYKTFYCVVDLHAITVRQVPAELRRRTYETLALYMACGLDEKKNTLFVQSHVPAHAELGWILDCYTMFGELSRMTQFKDKSQKHAENINAGLFTYPALMAADILLYQTDVVPTGVDQKQHLELARDIAERFNQVYGDTFTVPESYIPTDTMKIMSLQEPTAKMSKSDPNDNAVVRILDSKDDIMRKFKKAVTDSEASVRFSEDKPGVSNLMTIYHAFTGKSFEDIEREFDGRGYGDFKMAVGEACADGLAPVREEFARLMADKAHLESVMKNGADEAAYYARKTMSKVRRKIGFVN
ncbi:MAG: tryptophan--tRNA ligase [Clostridia bacterium]|nr:tryptophan--tRNA ligase [Clostridia bacterium]MBO5316611.1 tryptophan--tRNA ligase [Clostridia bacterium]MBR3806181.1 tryptophan--tRNA ligase [Clostridia bacterium]